MNLSTSFNNRLSILLKATLFCIVFTGFYVLIYFIKSPANNKSEKLTHAIIGTVVALLTTILFLKFDKKSFADIGLQMEKSTFKKIILGILIGIGLMGFISASVIYFSDFNIENNQSTSIVKFFWGTLPLFPLAYMEELAFRAYPLSILKDKLGNRNAIITTSILFGAYHMANGWTLQNAFLGAAVWGIIFGLAAIYSKGIALPTGLHYTVNVTTAAFGINSSGVNLWVLKDNKGLSLENYQSSQLETLIPQISLLLFGIICMEWYLKKADTTSNRSNIGTVQ